MNLIDPIIFDDREQAQPTEESAGIDLATETTGPGLFAGLIRRETEPPVPIELLPPDAWPAMPLAEPSTPPLQIVAGINYYNQPQLAAASFEARGSTASESPQPPAPKAMDMAEKLAGMEHFKSFEGALYVFDKNQGIYRALSRDDIKSAIIERLADDLRVRGTAYQVKEIYEFLRLHPRLKIASGPEKHLLAFTNGVLDLRTSTFTYGHSADDFLTWRIEIPFDLHENHCPNFQKVLRQLSGGDPIFVARLMEIMAFLLIPSNFTKAIVLFQGLSSTGKSLLARLISSFYDPALVSHIAAYQFRDRFSTANLQGKQLNVSMDLPDGKITAEAVAMLKQITGGDEVFIETKGVDGHTAHLDCRFLFGTNHPFVPTVQDEAFTDRIVLLPFLYPIPPDAVDFDLEQKLLPERTAIFNLVLDAFWTLQRNNFQFTGEDRYGIRVAGLGNTEADPLLNAFIRDRCILDPAGQVPTSTLFDEYEAFLAERGCTTAWTTQQFSRAFNEATPASVITKKIRISGNPTNCYVGISLKGESDD